LGAGALEAAGRAYTGSAFTPRLRKVVALALIRRFGEEQPYRTVTFGREHRLAPYSR
jgi:hypothetical protein